MKWFLCLGLLSSSLLGVNGEQPEAKKEDPAANDLAKLHGKWQVVETEHEGTVTKNRGAIMMIDKSFWIDLDGDGKPCGKASIKLDASHSPRRLDMTIVSINIFPDAKGKTIQSIYQVEGDTLKMAATWAPFQAYPDGFKTTKSSSFIVITYKRIKP